MTTVASFTPNTLNDSDNGFSYRDFIDPGNLLSGSLGQIRITVQAGGTGLDCDHAAIGVATSTTATSITTATPTEITFPGFAHGFSIAGSNSIVSDWINFSFAITDGIIPIFDWSAAGNMSCQRTNGLTGPQRYFYVAAATYNLANPGAESGSSAGTVDGGLILIETQSGIVGGIPIWCVRL